MMAAKILHRDFDSIKIFSKIFQSKSLCFLQIGQRRFINAEMRKTNARRSTIVAPEGRSNK